MPDVVILCGGLGTRLGSVVKDRPKPLAAIGDRPFMDILLKSVFDQGFKRVILAVGHMKNQFIRRYSGDERILFSEEEKPLGTGGAVMKAMNLVKSRSFVVMNGDCHSEADLKKIIAEHSENKPLITMALARMDDVSDYGSVSMDESKRILAFREKLPQKSPGLINAGIYVFDREISKYAPNKASFSLETELFPTIPEGKFYGHVIGGEVLDIGTPERYYSAEEKLNKRFS